MTIEPDTKDWTWVLERACPDCSFDASTVRGEDLAELLHENTRHWYAVLDAPDAQVRPAPHIWSPLEYACHVRDVHRVFADRLARILEEDDPAFESWDQDATAVEQRYDLQHPETVGVELIEAAAEVAGRYSLVRPDQWERTGRRSDGSLFSVLTLGRYHLHDVHHHLRDVGVGPE